MPSSGMPGATALTVILPHYDCAAYLRPAVASVLGQDFRDLSLVVVDDCSPGDAWTGALLPFAADPRLLVLRTSRNVGHLRIKNAVLRRVRSPWVGFQDADDISLPGRFRQQVAMLAAGRAELVGCGYQYIDGAGRVTGHRRMPRNGNLWMRLGRSTVAHHPATVVSREALERLGGFDGTARLGADTDFHLRLSYLYRLRNTRRLLYQYRVWPGSLTQAAETGFGSSVRRAYTAAMTAQEQARRRAGSWKELLPLLLAPSNDVDFELRPVPLG